MYQLDIITDPHRPDSDYDSFQNLVKKFKIVNQQSFNRDNGLIQQKYEILFPADRRLIDNLASNLNYYPFSYSLSYDAEFNLSDLNEIIKAFLKLWYKMDVASIRNLNINRVITFIPLDRKGRHIYYKGNTLYDLSFDEIKDYKFISTDPLTPYVIQNMYPNDDPSLYKSYQKMFLIKRGTRHQIYLDVDRNPDNDQEKVNYIRGRIKQLKEDGYLSFPSMNQLINQMINHSIHQTDINIAAEIISLSKGQILLIEPILIGRVSTNLLLSESIDKIKDNQLPVYYLNAPSIWIVHTKNDIENDPISRLQLEYFAILAYLETLKKYPILIETLSSLRILSRNTLTAQFPHCQAVDDFNQFLLEQIKRGLAKNGPRFQVFDNYSAAIGFRWSNKYLKSLIIQYQDNFYVMYELDNGVEIPIFDKQTKMIKEIEYNLTIENLLSLKSIGDHQYVDDQKFQKYKLNGYLDSPFLKGIINPDNYQSTYLLNLGSILMNKNQLTNNLSLYTFEVSVTADDLYVPINNGMLSKFKDGEVIRRDIESRLYESYGSISNIYPSQDPGFIFPLFDISLPTNKYQDEEIYSYVTQLWQQGSFLSLWGKQIYTDSGKLSSAFLHLPQIDI